MTYIFDIDGTLADCSHRVHFITPATDCKAVFTEDSVKLDWDGPDWESFYKNCVNDKPIQPVIVLLSDLLKSGAKIIFVTGRPCKYMNETIQWLKKYTESDVHGLYMRQNGDHKPDYVIKKEIYENHIKPHLGMDAIAGVFEDRKQCVEMWRSLGLTCYQVADGNY